MTKFEKWKIYVKKNIGIKILNSIIAFIVLSILPFILLVSYNSNSKIVLVIFLAVYIISSILLWFTPINKWIWWAITAGIIIQFFIIIPYYDKQQKNQDCEYIAQNCTKNKWGYVCNNRQMTGVHFCDK